jgi:nucleoside-diphosphate-sugar epimerase
MPEPVLLTGATGFIGRAVLAELVAGGVPVHAVSRKADTAQDGVVWHRADLLTPEGRAAVAGLAPRLIHCAWEVEHGLFWNSPANALWQGASVDLAQRFRASGGQRILAIGTCVEYDSTAPGPWNESRPIAPATPYGQAKAALHRHLYDLCGDDLIWARLFHLYGPGEDRSRLIPYLIDRLRAGQPAEVRASGLVRDYASTAHVARCIVTLIKAGSPGAVDVGSGMSMTLGDLAHTVAKAVGADGLLHLSHQPGPADPVRMTPQLDRLFSTGGLARENLADALGKYALRHRSSDA